jgi:hypothetical protein
MSTIVAYALSSHLQVLFFFPLAPFVRGLYGRPELVPYLLNDRGAPDLPPGHTTNSRGFKIKVTDNPVMNSDHRGLALVGTTDGVPYFDDMKRTAWPFILRVANLPDGLSTHISNTHLHLIAASEYWDLDKDAKVLKRKVRGHKSLMPAMNIIVDDLLGGYNKGQSPQNASHL